MKKIILCLCLSYFFIGCAGIQFTGNTKAIVEQMAGKRLAYELAYKNPQLIEDGMKFCDIILTTKTSYDYLVTKGLERLEQEVSKKSDKMLVSDLKLMMGNVRVNGEFDREKVKNFVIGFKYGLELRK